MPEGVRSKDTGGSWSNSRIDGSKPFNLKFYPNETRIGQWREISHRSRKGHYYNPESDLLMPKNSFSVERMCYNQGVGGRDYKGCYYPTVDQSRYGKDQGKNYGGTGSPNAPPPVLIYTLQNDKGENVSHGMQTYNKVNLSTTFHTFNPQSISFSGIIDRIDENKLGNDGKVYGKAFVALFPALPDVPQVHPSYYETHSAESAQKYFTEYNEAKYLSQQDGRLVSNTVSFSMQIREPIPIITIKKKLKVI